ncbi:hypothetical protein, partial [Peribacillus sp. SI8-4]|uniref:hypothetical protein n=1 Tax=Peribacillus sp. SI8-4 TaxID=3048009 RepID=UPI0025562B07
MDSLYIENDTHLDRVLATLTGREKRTGIQIQEGLKVIWSKAELLDFSEWAENTYTSWSKAQKE